MRRAGHSSAYIPTLRSPELNRRSPHYAGLVGLWSFMPSSHATVVRDLVNGNDATTPGTPATQWGWQESDGVFGTGVYQPGSTNNVWDCGNDARLQVTANGLTVCAWVRLYQNLGSTNYPGIVGKGDLDSSTQGSYVVYITTNNKLNSFLYAGGARVNGLTGGTALDFQQHYHFALAWQPGVRTSLFVNGIRDATTTTSIPATLDNPSYNFLIGANQGGATKSAYPFRGMIYEARLYNICKSDDEIYQLYNARTRWDVYRAPARIFGYKASAAPTGRVYGPAIQ